MGADEFVGRVIHDIHINISLGVETTPSNFSYPPPIRSSIVLSFKVVCAKNYYGPDCSRFCNKNCTCDPGFTGEFCHEIDDCQGPEVACGTNQRCIDGVDNYTCVCSPGYTGENCDIDIDECQTMSIDCGENGQCVDGLDTFICSCDAGYSGENCEVEINECESMNITCSGHGQCMDQINNFICACEEGYTGKNCDVNIDDCQAASINCSGRGQCIDEINTFTCACDEGYTGKYCEMGINECENINITCSGHGNECENLNIICSGHGQCVDEANSYSCVCDPNFTGETCSEILVPMDETQVPSKNLNLKAILGGTIGLLVFLVVSLLSVVGAMAVVIRGHKKKGE